MREKLKTVLTLVITLCVLSMPLVGSYALFYNEAQPPASYGINGVYYAKYINFNPPYGGGSNLDLWVLVPKDKIGDFAFDGNGDLINITTSTINTYGLASNGETYYIQMRSFEVPRIRSQSSPYTYTTITHKKGFDDTNLHFAGDTSPMSWNTWANNNFNVTDGENLIFVALIILIILEAVNVFAYRRFRHN